MSAPGLHIDAEQVQARVPVTIIHIAGSVDAATYAQVQAAVDAAYDAGARYVLFDLADVDYVSSAGLRVLHRLNDRLNDEPKDGDAPEQPQGGIVKSQHVKLLNPSKNVVRLLEVAGFILFLDIYTDRDAAIASFS